MYLVCPPIGRLSLGAAQQYAYFRKMLYTFSFFFSFFTVCTHVKRGPLENHSTHMQGSVGAAIQAGIMSRGAVKGTMNSHWAATIDQVGPGWMSRWHRSD